MPRWSVQVTLIAVLLGLSACQLALPGAEPDPSGQEPTPNAVIGGDIEVTALDAAPAATEASPADAAAPAPDAAPVEAVAPKSDARLACERKGGTWASLGNATTRTCVRATKDGGKSCKRESQCESQCLARSGTCAPLTPLLGCNEVLQENGARVTLCID